MMLGLKTSVLLLLAALTVKAEPHPGFDLSEIFDNDGPETTESTAGGFDLWEALGLGRDLIDVFTDDQQEEKAANRLKRGIGYGLYDLSRGKGVSSSTPKPTPPTRDLKPSRSAGGDAVFDLEDALRPAMKPTDEPRGGGGACQNTVVQQLKTVMENQNQQLRLLRQLIGRSSSGRFRSK